MSFLDKLKDSLGFNEGKASHQDLYAPPPVPQDKATQIMSSDTVPFSNSVNGTFENAIKQAKQHKLPVHVDINGVDGILVDSQSSVQGMMDTYNAAQKLQREKGAGAAKQFLADTPESQRLHQAMHGTTQQRNATMQQHMDMLVTDLPQRLEDGRDSTVAWIGAFSKAADNLHIGYNRNAVISAFEGAGYDKSLVNDQTQSATGFGNRIIGATLEQLEQVGTVHPGMSKQCAEYAHLSSRERAQGVASNTLQQTLNTISTDTPELDRHKQTGPAQRPGRSM